MKNLLVVIGAILVTGRLLDLAGRGKLGTWAQSEALKITRGYGQGA